MQPMLYIVTKETVIKPRHPEYKVPTDLWGGGYLYYGAQKFDEVKQEVIFASTCYWMARLVCWWHKATMNYETQAFTDYDETLEDWS